MSMKASEVITTFSFSVAKHRRIAAAKNLVHGDTAVCIFLFKRKESELLFRNRFSSGKIENFSLFCFLTSSWRIL